MIVRVRRHQLAYFLAKAKESPNEILAFLIGQCVSPNLIEIRKFRYPKLTISDPDNVFVDSDEYERWEEKAKDDGLLLLGGIHSHPNWTTEMSRTDFHNHKQNGEKVTGIVGIIRKKTYTSFWVIESALPCKVEYF